MSTVHVASAGRHKVEIAVREGDAGRPPLMAAEDLAELLHGVASKWPLLVSFINVQSMSFQYAQELVDGKLGIRPLLAQPEEPPEAGRLMVCGINANRLSHLTHVLWTADAPAAAEPSLPLPPQRMGRARRMRA